MSPESTSNPLQQMGEITPPQTVAGMRKEYP